MIDIITPSQSGLDLGVLDTDVERAKNILSVQIGALTYEQEFGIDLKYFLSQPYAFQNDSFKSYCVQRLASYSVNVISVREIVESLFTNLTFNIDQTQAQDGALVAR